MAPTLELHNCHLEEDNPRVAPGSSGATEAEGRKSFLGTQTQIGCYYRTATFSVSLMSKLHWQKTKEEKQRHSLDGSVGCWEMATKLDCHLCPWDLQNN